MPLKRWQAIGNKVTLSLKVAQLVKTCVRQRKDYQESQWRSDSSQTLVNCHLLVVTGGISRFCQVFIAFRKHPRFHVNNLTAPLIFIYVYWCVAYCVLLFVVLDEL
jgi:hypothetical protein